MANTGLATEDLRYLDLIHDRLSGSQQSLSGINSQIISINSATLDPSAITNGWQTIELFSAVVATNTVTTGATINTKASSSQTILIDVTGANTGATGLIYTLRAGLSGLAFFTLRSTTAGLGSFAFKVGQAGVTTGATADTTGATRYDDMFLQINNPTTATGGSVTVRARAFLSPSS